MKSPPSLALVALVITATGACSSSSTHGDDRAACAALFAQPLSKWIASDDVVTSENEHAMRRAYQSVRAEARQGGDLQTALSHLLADLAAHAQAPLLTTDYGSAEGACVAQDLGPGQPRPSAAP